MKTLALMALLLACTRAEAHTYRCPAKDAGAGLTNAEIRIGERDHAHAVHGDVDQVEGGTNIHVDRASDDPAWLVCQYGGRRVEGTVISRPEAIGAREAWIQLAPTTAACDLAIRRARSQSKERQAWSATATCKSRQPPPPDLM